MFYEETTKPPNDLVLTEVKLKEEIGRGAYGKVYKSEYHGSVCAAREFHLNLTLGIHDQKMKDDLPKKCEQFTHLRHPNIVQFLGVFYKPGSSTVPLLVMEMLETNLSSYLESCPNIDLATKLSILLDISLGLKYLHCRKPIIVHGNIQSNNILLASELKAKISDTGVGQLIKTDKLLIKKDVKSTYFMAPEIQTDKSSTVPKFSTPVDVFSYGAVILHTFTQQWPKPVSYRQPIANFKKLTEVESPYKPHIDKVVIENKEFGSLAVACLNYDTTKRPNIVKVLETVKKNAEKSPVTKSSITWQIKAKQAVEQV